MSEALFTISRDDLADVLRHYLFAHVLKQVPFDKLNDDGKKHWRDAADREIKKLEQRRAAASREQRARR